MFKNIIRLNKRFFSTSSPSPSTSTLQIPSNLSLPDLTILNPPKESILKKYEDLFPPNPIDITLPIINFLNPEEKSIKNINLNLKVFNVAIRQDIIHSIIRYHHAKDRQPYCTKRISDIRGSTRKLYQQKGTGHARAGQSRAAHRRGGMKSHGPVLRDFSIDINRKIRALGMMVALAAKLKEGNLIIVDKLELSVRYSFSISFFLSFLNNDK